MPTQRDTIIVLCTGNICRSPMGERLLQNALAAENAPLNKIKVLSAGIAAWPGDPASPNAVEALAKINIQMKQHASQPLSHALLEKAFLVLGMTPSHLQALEAFPETKPKRAHLFREFIGADADEEIPDPYGQNLEAYRACLDSMAEAIPSILNYLRSEYRC
ncbi:MAG: Protein-arginine-phosphatase [Opitutia bacterium UBA7350]|nr:MAG: Protein-arginine-phosphatase [Opitutae bacterium UBA7350]